MTDRRMLLVAHTGRSDISEIADAAAKKLTDGGHRPGLAVPGER